MSSAHIRKAARSVPIIVTVLPMIFGGTTQAKSPLSGVQDALVEPKMAEKRAACRPNSVGLARGTKRCVPPRGSSSGVARGDFNGDGIGDLALGVPFEDIGTLKDAGGVNVLYGSPLGLTAGGGTSGVPLNQFIHQDSPGVPGTAEAGDQLGRSVASGDFDADGFSDLAIGIPFEDTDSNRAKDAGMVLILYGSAAGLRLDHTQELISRDANEQFGWALSWGDFNGDHVADLAVGAPNRFVSTIDYGTCEYVPPIFLRCTVAPGRAGGVSVFYGLGGDGLDFNRRDSFRQNDEDTVSSTFSEVGDGAEPNERFGETLAAGDFDDDGTDDLVVGAPGNNKNRFLQPKATGDGSVHVIFGDFHGLGRRGNPNVGEPFISITQDGVWSGNNPVLATIGDDGVIGTSESGDTFGASLAVGRRAGADALYIGVPGEGVVVFQPTTGSFTVKDRAGSVLELNRLASASDVINNDVLWTQDSPGIAGVVEAGDQFGFSLAAADFNGDGRPDLAVGVPFEDLTLAGVSHANAGAVHVIYGSSGGLSASGDQIWTQASDPNFGTGSPEANDQFGYALAAWDFGNGSRADLVIGVPGEDLFGFADAGLVHVLYGSATGLDVPGNQFWHQDKPGILDQIEAGDQFGQAAY